MLDWTSGGIKRVKSCFPCKILKPFAFPFVMQAAAVGLSAVPSYSGCNGVTGRVGRPGALLVDPMGSNDPSTPSKAAKSSDKVLDCTAFSSFRLDALVLLSLAI
jgi:hypothetical protein